MDKASNKSRGGDRDGSCCAPGTLHSTGSRRTESSFSSGPYQGDLVAAVVEEADMIR